MTVIHGLTARDIPDCSLHPDFKPSKIWTKDGFDYFQCQQCGLMWVNPQLTDEAVAEIYATGFKHKQGKHPVYPGKNRFREGLSLIAPYRKNGGRVLDIGTFTGHFLVAAREDGWKITEGTEISQDAATYARNEYDLTIHPGDLLSIELTPDTYDAITLSDVIEHVSDPLATIKQTHKLLRPGGVLYMHTPHFNSIPRYIHGQEWSVFFPWHRTIFTANAMREMLETSGYRIKILRTVGILPINTMSAWERYLRQKETLETEIEANIGANQSTRKNMRLRNLLRPIWLSTKRAMDLPFIPLSWLNIHIGARLVVCAEKI